MHFLTISKLQKSSATFSTRSLSSVLKIFSGEATKVAETQPVVV
jgi:hypothetical protein